MRKILIFLSIVLIFVLAAGLVACGANANTSDEIIPDDVNGGENNNEHTESFCIFVRDAYFGTTGTKLYYDGVEIGEVKNVPFEVSVTFEGEFDQTKFATDRENCTFIITEKRDFLIGENNFQTRLFTIIEVENGTAQDGFMDIGGKVVLHSDGETRKSGATFYLDGNVITSSAPGDFNLCYIPVGAKFSASYTGYETVDIANNFFSGFIVDKDREVYTFRLSPAEE